MAPRLRTATIGEDQRPSSSSGPGSGRVSARHADLNDKRKSRDDLLIGTMTAEKQRFQSFHVPIRGRLPSPPQPGFSRHPQHDARLSDGSQIIAIGMALGSPSHAPAGARTAWQPQLASVMSPMSSDAQESPAESTPKTKSRKWGLFRGKSKAKKKAQSETSSPQLVSTPIMSPAGPATKSSMLRSDSAAVHSARHKPLVVRSNTEPIMAMESGLPSRPSPNRQSPQPPHRPIQTTPARYGERPAPNSGFHLPKSRGPLLDVEIPDITMERYSVMFGHVLDKKRASRDQSSLLVRRQATLTKLKTINAEPQEVLQPPRRMSSPQAKSSPTFHLFPPTPKNTGLNQAQSPRSRSNTSPAGLPSPNQTSFKQAPPRMQAPRSQTFPHIAHGNHSTDRLLSATTPRERRPTLNSRFQKSTPQLRTTDNVFDSPTSITESPVSEMKATYQPNVKDPAWEMISPPPSTTSSHAGTPKKGSLSSITSNEAISIVKPSPQPQPTPEENEADCTLRQAVEASITRQISVSRDQRQLLGSLRGNGNRRRRATDAKQPIGFGPAVATGGNERLVESAKKLTPTLVHPEPEPASGEQPRSLHMHRRSERVVVEGA